MVCFNLFVRALAREARSPNLEPTSLVRRVLCNVRQQRQEVCAKVWKLQALTHETRFCKHPQNAHRALKERPLQGLLPDADQGSRTPFVFRSLPGSSTLNCRRCS